MYINFLYSGEIYNKLQREGTNFGILPLRCYLRTHGHQEDPGKNHRMVYLGRSCQRCLFLGKQIAYNSVFSLVSSLKIIFLCIVIAVCRYNTDMYTYSSGSFICIHTYTHTNTLISTI